ncbi:MAG: DUF4838 domain-containing protein, partial [Phycisphaeraceae bacterium]
MQGFTTARRALFAALVCCTTVHTAHAAPFILAEDGQAKCVIIHHPDATPPEQHAARELQRYLERITGATFERRAAEAPGEGRAILIGSGPWTEDVVSADERAALGTEGYILRTAGDGKRLHVIGGRPRGTLYGVYDLLRDEFACRWFTPRIERVPSRPTLTVDALDRTYVPPFEYRHIRYHMADDPDWAAKMHIHGYDRDRPELGGSFNYAQAWRVHTLRHFAPGGNHDPEDPSMADGDRAGLMSDALVEHAADTIRAVFDEQPEAEIVSLSQEDSVRRFDDEAARALIEREGSSSAVVLQFVNRVAERVAETHPEKVLSTLAYWWTIEPPETMRARENVAIRFAIMGAALNKPLTDPVNADYQSNLKGWSRLAERMYLWMYAQTGNKGGLTFSAPLPTVFVYDEDFR